MTFLFFDLKVRFFFHRHLGGLFCAKILFFLWLFIFIEDFIKDFTKDFAAKPPAERSDANKVLSEARLPERV